jgi:hypothetical protein
MVEEKGAQLRPKSPQPERRRYKGIHDRSKEIVAVGRAAARNSFKLHRDSLGQLTKRKETSSTWHAGSDTAGDSQLRAQNLAAQALFDDPEYQPLKGLRRRVSKTDAVVVEGL